MNDGKVRRGFIAAMAAMLLGAAAFAAQADTIAYQGYLTSGTGQPVNGTVSVQFRLHAAASGGDPLWQETQSVAVSSGGYSVLLGSVQPFPPGLFNAPLFLGVRVGGDAEMAPRQALASVPYAFRAKSADNVPACAEGAVLVFKAGAWQCGSVGLFSNAVGVCVANQCSVSGCVAGFGDCDASSANGCETPLVTNLQHCGACGNACAAQAWPNVATYTCQASQCGIGSCADGFLNSNNIASDGCEAPLDTSPACNTNTFLGSVSGDTGAGLLTFTGAGEAWFRVRLTEDSAASIALSASVTLTFDSQTDYDLFVYCASCAGSLAGYSTGLSGTEFVEVAWPDVAGDQGGDFLIEVKFFGGVPDVPWQLNVAGNAGVAVMTCPSP